MRNYKAKLTTGVQVDNGNVPLALHLALSKAVQSQLID